MGLAPDVETARINEAMASLPGMQTADVSIASANGCCRSGGKSYEKPAYQGHGAVLDALEANDPAILGPMIIAAALYEDDFDVAYRACVRLSSHSDEIVRGNAILGFGHLVRSFGRLGDEAPSIVRQGLTDASSYVRGQAYAAAGDLHHFLAVEVRERGAE